MSVIRACTMHSMPNYRVSIVLRQCANLYIAPSANNCSNVGPRGLTKRCAGTRQPFYIVYRLCKWLSSLGKFMARYFFSHLPKQNLKTKLTSCYYCNAYSMGKCPKLLTQRPINLNVGSCGITYCTYI